MALVGKERFEHFRSQILDCRLSIGPLWKWDFAEG
jgi:hypothetical protein